MRTSALALLLLLGAAAHADPAPPSGKAALRAASIVRRAETRKDLRRTQHGAWVKRSWFEPRSAGEIPIDGELQVRTRGHAVVVRSEVPAEQDGVSGVLVHQLVASLAAPTHADEKVEAPTRRAMKQVLAAAYKEALLPIQIADLYRGALDAIDQHPSHDKIGLMRAAARGATARLGDKWTAYYEPTAWQNTLGQLSNDGRVPVGVQMQAGGQGLLLTHIVPGSAAARAGLQPNDRLLSIDGQPVTTIPDAIARLRGLPGTSLQVHVLRNGAPVTFAITRAPIAFLTSQLHGGIGVVRFGDFRKGAAAEVDQAIADLERQNGKPLTGLVLDLRGNTGGYVKESADLANIFLGSGSLGSLRTRSGQISEDYPADPGKATHPALPLTVLVDRDTVSASEFVTSVFKDRRRAVVLGEQTYGKGVGQLNRTYADGSGLRMTFTRFHVPSGAPLPHGTGVVPDVTRATAEARVQARGVVTQDALLEEALFHLRQQAASPAP